MKKTLKKILLFFVISTVASPAYGMEGAQGIYEQLCNNIDFVCKRSKQLVINHPYIATGAICFGATTTAYLTYKWLFSKPNNTPKDNASNTPDTLISNSNDQPKSDTPTENKIEESQVTNNDNDQSSSSDNSTATIIPNPAITTRRQNLTITDPQHYPSITPQQPNNIADVISNMTSGQISLTELPKFINNIDQAGFNITFVTNDLVPTLEEILPNYFPKNQNGLCKVIDATTNALLFASLQTSQGYICLEPKNNNVITNAIEWNTNEAHSSLIMPSAAINTTPEIKIISSSQTILDKLLNPFKFEQTKPIKLNAIIITQEQLKLTLNNNPSIQQKITLESHISNQNLTYINKIEKINASSTQQTQESKAWRYKEYVTESNLENVIKNDNSANAVYVNYKKELPQGFFKHISQLALTAIAILKKQQMTIAFIALLGYNSLQVTKMNEVGDLTTNKNGTVNKNIKTYESIQHIKNETNKYHNSKKKNDKSNKKKNLYPQPKKNIKNQ